MRRGDGVTSGLLAPGSGAFRGRRFGAFAGQEVFDGRGQVRDAGLQFLQVVGQRSLVAAATVMVVRVAVAMRVAVVVGVIVAALTGRVGPLSAPRFAGMPAAVGQRGQLPDVVPHR